jgi:hypothetical protein
MPAAVLTDATIWAHDFNLSTSSNKVTLHASVKDQDATTFGGNGYTARLAGLRDTECKLEGFWDGLSDASTYTNFGIFDQVVTVAPTSAEGARGYMYQAGRTDYEFFDAVGNVIPFKFTALGSNTVGLIRGLVVDAPGSISATGVTGTPQQVGAGGAGKFLYAAYHVFTAGTTMTIQVQSSATLGGTYVTRGTFPAFTAVGGYWLTRVDASAITDSWWRLNVSAITGTFNGAGSIAVQ